MLYIYRAIQPSDNKTSKTKWRFAVTSRMSIYSQSSCLPSKILNGKSIYKRGAIGKILINEVNSVHVLKFKLCGIFRLIQTNINTERKMQCKYKRVNISFILMEQISQILENQTGNPCLTGFFLSNMFKDCIVSTKVCYSF